MVARPRADRSAKRAELALAATRAFAEHGVASATVSDIVKAAGVAQGTFYLYFDSKDEIVLAVVEQMAEGLTAAIEAAVQASGTTAVDKLLGLRDVLASAANEPGASDFADFLHSPENRSLHDRLEEHMAPALVPLVLSIVSQGVDEGVFDVPDIPAAAWFVIGGLRSAEASGTTSTELGSAVEIVTQLALRALGYKEPTS